MPVYVGGEVNRIGHKWAAESMDNAERGDMPMGVDVILLHDLEHAIPHAIMEGGLITAMRTSAVAGVGAKYLARPDSKVAGLVGAGVIGRTMIMSLTTAMPSLETYGCMILTVNALKDWKKNLKTLLMWSSLMELKKRSGMRIS